MAITLSALHIPLLTLISGAAAGGATYAAIKGDITALRDAHAETRARVEKVEPVVQDLRTGQAVMNQKLDDQGEALKRIEHHLGTR